MTSNPITHPSLGFELSPDQLLFTTDEAGARAQRRPHDDLHADARR